MYFAGVPSSQLEERILLLRPESVFAVEDAVDDFNETSDGLLLVGQADGTSLDTPSLTQTVSPGGKRHDRSAL